MAAKSAAMNRPDLPDCKDAQVRRADSRPVWHECTSICAAIAFKHKPDQPRCADFLALDEDVRTLASASARLRMNLGSAAPKRGGPKPQESIQPEGAVEVPSRLNHAC